MLQKAKGPRAARDRRPLGARVAWLGLVALGCDALVEPGYEGEPLISINGRVEAPLGVGDVEVGDVEVGVLWLQAANDPFDTAVECRIEPSGEPPGPCAVACGAPSCDDLAALEAWEACASQCEGPIGVALVIIEASSDLLFEGAVGQTTRAQGAFPARFRLDLLAPPPDAVLTRSSTGERLAIGLFVALDPAGAPFELDLDELPDYPPWLLGGSGSHILAFTPEGVPRASQWGTLLELEVSPGYQLMEVLSVHGVNAEGEEEDGTEFIPVPASDATRVDLTVADPATIAWPLSG